MDDEFASPPRRPNPKRLHRKAESSPEVLEQQQRLKREMHLTRELIDFDLIKGSALFHTKPSSHDRKLVQEGLGRALFVPFHAKFWRQKPWFYETATALYALHVAALCIYMFHHKTTSAHNTFEVFFPICLLFLVAIGYGRVSSVLQAPDTEPSCKILSPSKQTTESVCSSESDNSHTTSGLASGLAESENSDGTDSDEDSGNSSSSSDESNPNDDMFPHKSNSAPTSPKRVKATPSRKFYRKVAEVSAITLSLVPIALRCAIKCQGFDCLTVTQEPLEVLSWISRLSKELSADRLYAHAESLATGDSMIAMSSLADAEVTYHRRFLYVLEARNIIYAKCFTALTSSRRSRLANLPHFRLKNVVNIKAWISLRGGRTWLKRQGRQRAADEIVSTSFLIILVLLVVMGMQAVSDGSGSLQPESIFHIEVAIWCMLSSVFMLRFMMLGSNINKKYQNTTLLLTEQMNVYLRLLAKPHKKEKLLVSNNVLKLACKLLKELNSPNKVSGLTMNPLLYNLTRVVVLSAFSSTASDFFGFKLKLWKLKA
uniref:PHTF1/2 N-terminal domain-containing protein n=1 Tax=Phytophthora ramorum TaxID=164328 RepID=H3GE08_PHYRM